MYVDLAERDPRSYIDEANRLIQEQVTLPPRLQCHLERPVRGHGTGTRTTAQVVLPLFLIFLLLWTTRSLVRTGIVLLAVPFSAIGAIWLLHLLGTT